MGEPFVRGLVIGLVFLLAALSARAAWALIRSTSEGARRLKWLLALALAVPFFLLLAQDLGVGGSLAAVAALAGIVWVVKGFQAKA